ncbi:hypothetical protein ACWF7H_17075 [Peribacillus butanolivorans]|uniref:hypothetical protein n=1 Tax=Peribacillus butanolivorans TaxID=421767 RepID=UPI0036869791
MDKYTKIEHELVKEYMPSIKELEGQKTHDLYSFVIKLSASMAVTALKKYNETEERD